MSGGNSSRWFNSYGRKVFPIPLPPRRALLTPLHPVDQGCHRIFLRQAPSRSAVDERRAGQRTVMLPSCPKNSSEGPGLPLNLFTTYVYGPGANVHTRGKRPGGTIAVKCPSAFWLKVAHGVS